jgi:hypothetical protein
MNPRFIRMREGFLLLLWGNGAHQERLTVKKAAIMVTAVVLTIGLVGFQGQATTHDAHAIGCPTYTTSGNGDTFNVQITGKDLSCPSTYSSSGIIHYALSTASGANPYTVVLSNCAGSICPPTNIKVLGWDIVGDRCGGSKPACPATGPWTFTIDATGQLSKTCDTAPAKIAGNGGQPVLILEAGTGGVCSPALGVPEFPLGTTVLMGVAMLGVLLMRSWRRETGLSVQPT